MPSNILRIMLDDFAYNPLHAHSTDAGIDLRSPVDVTIPPMCSVLIDTGVHIELPHGHAGLLVSKSGLNTKHCVQTTGLIDEGFQGSIRVRVYNHDPNNKYEIKAGDKITQIVIFPVWYPSSAQYVTEFADETERGSNGYGSTGR